MISVEDYKQFLLQVKDEKDSTITGVSPKSFSVSVVEKQDSEKGKISRHLKFEKDGNEYAVSNRAKSHILKHSGFTGRLLKELTVPEINSGLNHQLTKINSYGMTAKGGILYALFNTSQYSFHPYDTLISGLSNTVSIHGNPLTSDIVEFQMYDGGSSRSGGLFVGMNAQVSSTSMAKSRFGYGVYRTVCQNGWVDCVYGKDVLPTVSTEIVAGMIKMYQEGMGGFIERLNSFVDGAGKFQILSSEHLEELFTHLSVPPKIKQSLYGCFNRSKAKEKEEEKEEKTDTMDLLLKSAGVDGVNTLWNVFQVLVWLSNRALTLRQSISMGRNVVRWADQILVSQN